MGGASRRRSSRCETSRGRRGHIALVSEPYYPDLGGMPEHVHNLGTQLVRLGHRVTLITTAYPRAPALAPRETAYRVVRLGRATSHIVSNGSQHHVAIGLRLRAQLTALFAHDPPDLVHLHGPIFPTLSLLAMHCAPASAALVGTLYTHFEDSRILRLFRSTAAALSGCAGWADCGQ